MSILSENVAISSTNYNEASIQYIPTPLTGHDSLMEFHYHLLSDSVRTEAFIRAIKNVVKPNDIVVDLGSGTGILAMACCRAGAKKVYAIESDRLISTSRQVAQRNGFDQQIVFIHKSSYQVNLPEKVNVIVSECLGLMGIGGAMVSAVIDMARRYLKDSGLIIPNDISLFLAPVESSFHYNYVHGWQQQTFYGFDFSPFQKIANNNVYIAWMPPENFLAQPQNVTTIQLLTDDVTQAEAKLQFLSTRSGSLHGFCGWFETNLGGGITLSASPLEKPTIWKQIYFPLEEEIPLTKGDLIKLNFGLKLEPMPGGIPGYFRWRTDVSSPNWQHEAITLKQATLKSIPKNLNAD